MTSTAKPEIVDAASPLASTAPPSDKKVKLPLAVFVSEDRAKRLGFGEKALQPGDSINVDGDLARSLISEGAIAVDPTDNEAVAKLLKV